MSRKSRDRWREENRRIHAAADAKPFNLAAGGACEIKAEEGKDEEGKAKLPTFAGNAYTGAPMRPDGWGTPIIVDLAGVKVPSQHRPALRQHDPEQIVGHTTSVKAGKDGIQVEGVLSGEQQHVDKVRTPAANGFQWQLSIGANPTKTSFLEAGETSTVNGREVTGPMTIAHETQIGEISFVPLGADGDTSATVQGSQGKVKAMNFRDMLKAAMKLMKAAKYNDDEIDKMSEDEAKANFKKCMADGDADDAKAAEDEKAKAAAKAKAADEPDGDEAKAKARRLKIAAEEERHDMIRAAISRSGITHIERDGKKVHFAAAAIGEGWTSDKVELEILRASRASAEAGSQAGPHLHFASEPLKGEAVVEAALLQAMRHQLRLSDDSFYTEKTPDGRGEMRRMPKYVQDDAQKDFKASGKYSEQVQDSAHRLFKGRISCQQVFRELFRANGSSMTLDLSNEQGIKSMMAEWDHMERQAVRASGTATMSIANILANVLNKFALQGYLYVEQSWRSISSIRPMNDFKPSKSINLLGDVMFKQFGPNGELVQASITDQAFANQVAPYGRMITIPWTYIVNDDLSMLSTVPMKIGQGAGLALNDTFWTLWTAMAAGTVNGDDGVAFWRTTSSTTQAAKLAGTAYKPNKYSGASSALSAASLNAVRALFENQTDPNGNPLGFDGMKPTLLFGPSNWQTATALMQAVAIVYGGASAALQPNANVWQGSMNAVQSKYIENSNYGNSTTAFWILFDPVALPVIETGFLNGIDTPAVLTAGPDYQFDRLGISIRGTMPFGVTQQNFRGGVYSVGA